MAFEADKTALFALWSRGSKPDVAVPRYSEIGIMVSKNGDVDKLYEQWMALNGIKVLLEPYDDVFGRTFMIQDPDGHLIRVSPLD